MELTKLETHLRKLLAEQKKQVDAIKKATNYDSTRKLIERYDEAGQQQFGMATPIQSNPSTPVRRGTGQGSPGSQSGKAGSVAGSQVKGKGDSPRAPGHLAGVAGTPGCECRQHLTGSAGVDKPRT